MKAMTTSVLLAATLVVGLLVAGEKAQSADTAWYLLVAGPSSNGDLRVEGAYATERGCNIVKEQSKVRGLTYAKCLELPSNVYVHNSERK